MHCSGRLWTILSLLWTLLSFASSLLILADVLGDTAWNGINFALGLYLLLSTAGSLGLLAGAIAVFSRKAFFAWITCISAATIAGLGALFSLGFIFGRDSQVPLNDAVHYGHVAISVLALYAAAFVCCSVEILVCFPRKQEKAG